MNRRLIIAFLYCFIFSSISGTEDQERQVYSKFIPKDCVFPFTFNNKEYNDCTTDGNNGIIPWCSITPKYEGYFTYCQNYRNSSLTCLPTYEINGKEYEGCNLISKTSRYKQCQTGDDDYKYRYCVEEEIVPKNRPLVNREKCDPAYKNLAPTHTMCVGPAENAVEVPLNASEKQLILKKHNDYRGNVSAEYMFKLYWDDELAKLAQAHSNLCAFDHDLAKNRISPKYFWLNGQNMVKAEDIRTPLATLLDVMFKVEKPFFSYGQPCKGKADSCLHYTQIMLKDMTRMGCGHTHCLYDDRIERFLTCNYIHSQFVNSSKFPYTESKVPGLLCNKNKMEGNLCDCGNVICNYSNYERIHPEKCECVPATDDGPFHKRDVEVQDDGAKVESGSGFSVSIPADADIEDFAGRDLQVISHNLQKRNVRKYSQLSQNNKENRMIVQFR